MTIVHTVVGIIKRNETFLVAERPANKSYAGYWEFPGGKMEKNELGLDALKRELDEELGIHDISASLWFEHTHLYPDKTVKLYIWQVTHFSGEPYGKENQTLRWVTLPEMQALPLLAGNGPIVEKLNS